MKYEFAVGLGRVGKYERRILVGQRIQSSKTSRHTWWCASYKFEMKSGLITISSLARAVENQGFFFLQGNTKRTKILTKEGVLMTQGK